MSALNDSADRWSRLALANVTREYPHKLDHLAHGPEDIRVPSALHPAFFGSFDWHSCVHQHWLLVRLLRQVPGLPAAAEVRATLDGLLTADHLATELAYLRRHGGFERPYGWAWLVALHAEVASWPDPDAARWGSALAPLRHVVAERWVDYALALTYPVRHGSHANSAFALLLVLQAAQATGDDELAELCRRAARGWFATDEDYPTRFEPSGEDFLSPALVEAALLGAVLPAGRYAGWLGGFLPGLDRGQHVRIRMPATVSDRTDPRIVHLDGLNLSRAWCWRLVAAALPGADSRREVAEAAAVRHLDAALPHVTTGEYAGEHWLATFALLALTTA